MARPIKKGLHYFNIDCNQDDNLTYIEAKHGIAGYGIVVKLWKKIYSTDGYFCLWNEKNLFLFAREIGVDKETISAVIDTCFDEGIFDRQKFLELEILTSRGIQKRYLKIVTEAKRKDCSIELTHSLLELIQDETIVNPEVFEKNPGKSTQSKVKESKLKENKEKETTLFSAGKIPKEPFAPAAPAPDKKKPDLDWKNWIDTWFDFYKKRNEDVPPKFDGAEAAAYKKIRKHLIKISTARYPDKPPDEAGLDAWKFILSQWDNLANWNRAQYDLKTIFSKLNDIVGQIKNGSGKTASKVNGQQLNDAFAKFHTPK